MKYFLLVLLIGCAPVKKPAALPPMDHADSTRTAIYNSNFDAPADSIKRYFGEGEPER